MPRGLAVLDDLIEDVRAIEARLTELKRALAPLSLLADSQPRVTRAASANAAAERPAKKRRRRKRIVMSADARAFRKKQGQYMGAVKGLSAANRAKVKKVRAVEGYDAALKLATSLKPDKAK